MLISLKKKAQSTAEYAMLIGLAIGAVTIVSAYVKKAIAGKIDRAVTVYLQSNGGLKVAARPYEGEARLHKADASAENQYSYNRYGVPQRRNNRQINDHSETDNVKAVIAGDSGEVELEVGDYDITTEGQIWPNRSKRKVKEEQPPVPN